MDGWMDGWMDEWMDGWILWVSLIFGILYYASQLDIHNEKKNCIFLQGT